MNKQKLNRNRFVLNQLSMSQKKKSGAKEKRGEEGLKSIFKGKTKRYNDEKEARHYRLMVTPPFLG